MTTVEDLRPDTASTLNPVEKILQQIGEWLLQSEYRFVTPTPLTHLRVNNRPENAIASNLRDIFGWTRPFPASLLPARIFHGMGEADLLEKRGDHFLSRIRFSSLPEGGLFVHSRFPTTESDSVFFGPDTYRFAAWVRSSDDFPAADRPRRILEIGCGSGAVGIAAALRSKKAGGSLSLTDINPRALSYSRVNAALAGLEGTEIFYSDVCEQTVGSFDLILANPPYLLDPQRRSYRHGGGAFGAGLSLRILRGALAHLAPGGQLLLYTGTAIVDGVDMFSHQARPILNGSGFASTYQEIDPDVFGEELEQATMKEVERIAVVGLKVQASLFSLQGGKSQ